MKIKILTLGELQTNCYLLFDDKTKDGIVIDPADEANFLSEQILQLNLNPLYLIATHGHFDHLLASSELQLAFNIPLLLHSNDLKLAKQMQKSAQWWLKRKIIEKAPSQIQFVKENDRIKIGNIVLKVIHTPGHSPGGICLYVQEEKILFTGDTLFAQGTPGRTDFAYGSALQLKRSLKKLSNLPPQTVLYPGHGEISSLGRSLPRI